MSLELDDSQLTFDRWHAIKDWVEGVSLVAEPSSTDESLLAKIIIDAKPDGLLINPLLLPNVPPEIELFITESNFFQPTFIPGVSLIIEVAPDILETGIDIPNQENSVFLQTDWNPLLLAQVLQQGFTGGICFTGGKEEITGVRDYNEMDDMMSLLR